MLSDDGALIEPTIDCVRDAPNDPDCRYEMGMSAGVLFYYIQLEHSKRFQEPQTWEKWVQGETVTPIIDLTKIDRVPVSFVVSASDGLCPPDIPMWMYSQIQSEKHIRFEHGGHIIYSWKADEAFIQRMIDTIETGTANPNGEKTSGFFDFLITPLFTKIFEGSLI